MSQAERSSKHVINLNLTNVNLFAVKPDVIYFPTQ